MTEEVRVILNYDEFKVLVDIRDLLREFVRLFQLYLALKFGGLGYSRDLEEIVKEFEER